MELEDETCLKEQYKIEGILDQEYLSLKLNKKTILLDNLYVMNVLYKILSIFHKIFIYEILFTWSNIPR